MNYYALQDSPITVYNINYCKLLTHRIHKWPQSRCQQTLISLVVGLHEMKTNR